jgi:regulatory protein
MRIDHFSSKPDRAGRYLLRFSDGSTMRLYRQTVEDFGLYAGLELSEEQMAALRENAGDVSAKMRAVRIVSASNVSRRDLEQRLVRKGESEAQAKAAVQWMEDLNLLDDSETARQIVSRCAAHGYGISRAKQVLYEKKIPKELWNAALEDFPDQTEHILKFLELKIADPADQKQVKRAVDALLRRGHSYGEVRRALSRMTADADYFLEE